MNKKIAVLIMIIVTAAVAIAVSAVILKNGYVPANNLVGDESAERCTALPKKYCGEGIEYNYIELPAIAFNVPAGTEIYSPVDGVFVSSGPSAEVATRGRVDSVSADGVQPGVSFSFITEFVPTIASGAEVKAGDVIGTAGAELVDDAINANLVFMVQGIDPSGAAFNDPELYKRFFGEYKSN